MKNKKALYCLTHGMYVLSTNGSSCFIDAVCQVSGGDEPLVSIAVSKMNFTNEILHKEKRYALSIFSKHDNPEIIKHFGFQSSRDVNKYLNSPSEVEVIKGVPVVKGMLGYLILEKVNTIENDTHTVFIGKVIDGDILKDDEPMTYAYYQEHKDELLKDDESNNTSYVCSVCGYIYQEDVLPDDYICPVCGASKDKFFKK